MNKEIDLQQFIDSKEVALVGRDNGKACRKRIESQVKSFDSIEKEVNEIIFKIPAQIVSMNNSFFLGCFADRVIALGAYNFSKKYHFDTSQYLQEKIQTFVEAAVLDVDQDEILNA